MLRKRRKELHLTQQQLADKLHVIRQTLFDGCFSDLYSYIFMVKCIRVWTCR
ncbi:helix-turn-helix transcriptional regulator [Streptococcus thermophilus]|uniref:helix-turn-helix transcriptional regulator n=1 Tax=Streptococcus thermophilus TaxID=1308 RepID=UPI00307C848E